MKLNTLSLIKKIKMFQMGTVVDELHIFFFLHYRALIVYYMSLVYFKRPDECRHEGRSNSSLIIP